MHIGSTSSRILSCAGYRPHRILTNEELGSSVDTSDQWIRERVGIRERHIAGPDESVADMASAAAATALDRAGAESRDVDLVIAATCTAMDRMPSIAAQVAARLGLSAPGAFDLNAACAGFSYALATADHAIRSGASARALVVGVDKMSDFIDWTDRSTCIIFGDGAGAVVVEAVPDGPDGIGPVVWGSDPAKGAHITITTTGPDGPRPLFRQDGQAVFRWTTTALAPTAVEACRRADVKPDELAGFVSHQANLRIINTLARRIGATNAVIATDVVASGNTSAASVPLALAGLVERHEIAEGAPVLLFGFGAGLSYSAQVIRCPSALVVSG